MSSRPTTRQNRNRCINCSFLIPRNLATHSITQATSPMINLLQSWIIPTQLSSECVLCTECLTLLQDQANTISEGRLSLPAFGHRSVCFPCGNSILRATRTYPVRQDRQERNILVRHVPLHLISRLERVCAACWRSATRKVQCHDQPKSNRPILSYTGSSGDLNIPEPPLPQQNLHTAKDVAESCADAGDSCPRDEPEVESTDICDDSVEDNDDSDPLVESNVCRVCLALDVKMYDLKDIELREMFQNITGIAVTENNHSLLERLCWECAGRLKAAAAFRNKALLSDALLQGLANSGEQVRKNDITLIKENEDYLKSAGALSIVEVFHTVEICPENESVPPITVNNDTEIVQNTGRKGSIELKEFIIKEDTEQMDVEDDSIIEASIKTEIAYDHASPNTGEESSNMFIETNPDVTNNIPFREDTINSMYSSHLPTCSHFEPKYPIIGYLRKTPSDCEDQIKKPEIKITNRDLIPKTVLKKLKEIIGHHCNNKNLMDNTVPNWEAKCNIKN